MIVVDTSVLVDHLRDEPRATSRILDATGRGEALAASTMTRVELLAGVRNRQLAPVERLFETLEWVEVTASIADRAGRWAREFARGHVGIDAVDYAIAATAAELDAELWTLTPFEIRLGFAAASCPNCDVPREPGVCPDCGAEIPEVDPGKLEQMRQKAFSSLASEARELVSSFDDPPEAEITLSVDQFLACVVDLDVIAKAGEFATLGNRLGELDFDDPKVVGGRARQTIVDYLERIRDLRCGLPGPESPDSSHHSETQYRSSVSAPFALKTARIGPAW